MAKGAQAESYLLSISQSVFAQGCQFSQNPLKINTPRMSRSGKSKLFGITAFIPYPISADFRNAFPVLKKIIIKKSKFPLVIFHIKHSKVEGI